MFDLVKRVNPTARPMNPDVWANEVRLMREIDGRTHAEICELFLWAKKDSFWCANIQSPGKLREKWNTLAERMARNPLAPRPGGQPAAGKSVAEQNAANAAEAKRLLFGGGQVDDNAEQEDPGVIEHA